MDLSLIKKHPYISGAVALIGGIIVLVIFRSGGGSASVDSGMGPTLAEQQLSAATGIQLSGIAAQTQAVTSQAQVANNQTAAQLSAVNTTTAAQLEAERIRTQADIVKSATDSATQIELAHITTQQQVNSLQAGLEDETIRANTALGISQIQADVYMNAVDAQRQVAIKELDNQHDLQTAVIAGASKDKSRSSTGWTQIISALFGQGPEAIAANQPTAVANSPSAIIGSIGGLVEGLFG